MMDTPPKVRRSDALRAGIKAQPRACGMPVAKRTLAELKADEEKTGLQVPSYFFFCELFGLDLKKNMQPNCSFSSNDISYYKMN
jgi:hypothetical protein